MEAKPGVKYVWCLWLLNERSLTNYFVSWNSSYFYPKAIYPVSSKILLCSLPSNRRSAVSGKGAENLTVRLSQEITLIIASIRTTKYQRQTEKTARNLILKHHNYPNRDYFVIYVSFMGRRGITSKAFRCEKGFLWTNRRLGVIRKLSQQVCWPYGVVGD